MAHSIFQRSLASFLIFSMLIGCNGYTAVPTTKSSLNSTSRVTLLDPLQAKMMRLMPIVFTVFMLWFPSGLVLYWIVNNLLTIIQQKYVNRQIERAYQASAK